MHWVKALCLCGLQATSGCFSHLQGPVPRAPDANAPQQQRVTYYNRYRPVQLVHMQVGRAPTYGPLPTQRLGASMLANGMEIRSLRELEPALNPDTELSLCALRVEQTATTATIMIAVAAALFVGGTGMGVAGIQNNRSLVVGVVGIGIATVGVVTFTVGVLGPGRASATSRDRGLTLYEPLLRERLGINPAPFNPEQPTGDLEPCR